MENKLLYKSFEGKLSLWAPLFKDFIEGKEMWDIYQVLKKDRHRGGVTPEPKDTFRAFSTTNPKTVKAVFVLMDPYPRKYKDGSLQATGLAMDCSNSPDGKLQPSLIKFYDAISKSEGKKVEYSPSLEYLTEQGVMLLNSDLTCRIGKTESHAGLWEPFMKYFFEEIMASRLDVVYVLCGKASQKLKKYINPFCTTLELTHPSHAARMGMDWDYKDIFNKVNKIIKDKHNLEIFWDKKDWEVETDDLPF